MVKKKPTAVATLIGDVVASRASGDREDLHRVLERVTGEVSARHPGEGGLRITVGDEYQGRYASLGEAIQVGYELTLGLRAAGYDVRHGLGWGPVGVLREQPRVEDGPGWWAAREAIESAAESAARPGFGSVRTQVRTAAGSERTDLPALEAALFCRDQVMGSLTTRGWRILSGVESGMSQVQIARAEGVTPSAVSQQVRSHGLALLAEVSERLRGLG